jgi:hypothetical protein
MPDSFRHDEALRVYDGNGFVLSALVPDNTGRFPSLIEVDCMMFASHRRQPARAIDARESSA